MRGEEMTKTEILKILEKYSDNDEVHISERDAKINDDLINLLPFVVENKDSLLDFLNSRPLLKRADSYMDIFILRVKDKCSLENISMRYGVSRERIRQQVNRFAELAYEFKNYKKPADFVEYEDKRIYDMVIEELDLTVRSYNAIKRNGINTIGDIVKLGIKGIRDIKNIGKKSAEELVEKTKNFSIKEIKQRQPIDEIWHLDLNYGCLAPLYHNGIKTIGDFGKLDIENIAKFKGLGLKRIEAISKELERVKKEL
jgi:DNA-directed RNA polymerase alpha subunit